MRKKKSRAIFAILRRRTFRSMRRHWQVRFHPSTSLAIPSHWLYIDENGN